MLTLEDKFEITELVAKFAHCSDFGDWEGLAKLYTPEVAVDMEDVEVRYVGIEGQVQHAKDSAQWTEGKNRHYNFNLLITEEDGKVFAEYAFINVNAGHEVMAAKIVVSGRMRDTVVKTADGWKIAHRYIRFDQKTGITS